jgi:hypothetical protein
MVSLHKRIKFAKGENEDRDDSYIWQWSLARYLLNISWIHKISPLSLLVLMSISSDCVKVGKHQKDRVSIHVPLPQTSFLLHIFFEELEMFLSHR